MGQSFSLGQVMPRKRKDQPKPRTVLVPPIFERDFQDRSRFAGSSYDNLFAKRQLAHLFEDYLQHPSGRLGAALLFAPPVDERFSTETQIGQGELAELRYAAHPAQAEGHGAGLFEPGCWTHAWLRHGH